MLKLDIGGGARQYGGEFKTLDINPKADIVHDLNKYPWPVKTSSVGFIRMSHTLEHLDDPLKAIKEIHRILEPYGQVFIAVPWWVDDMFGNPYHKWCFRPEWFKRLEKRSNTNVHMETCRGDIYFRVVQLRYLRGNIRFWKRYETRAVLEAIK